MTDMLVDIVDLGAGIMALVLNRPEKRNALSTALLKELAEALTSVLSEDACRVVVLAARGKLFSAGGDVGEERIYPVGEPGSSEAWLMECKALMLAARQPIVARIHADVIGGGIGLVAAADIVVAHSQAGFVFTEARLGLAPTLAVTSVVPRIGQAAALRMMLLGERISGCLACEYGLVSSCVEPEELDASLSGVLAGLLAASPSALANCKMLVRSMADLNRIPTVEQLYRLNSELIVSPDAQEAAAAAREKRHPSWRAAAPTAETITRLLEAKPPANS